MKRHPVPLPTAVPRATVRSVQRKQRGSVDPSLPVSTALPAIPSLSQSRKLSRASGSFVVKPIERVELPNARFRVRASSLKESELPYLEREFQITFHFLSNWGDTDRITCSEVDFLNKDRKPIQKVKVTGDKSATNLNCLSNHVMIKEEGDPIWSQSAPTPEKPVMVCFTITVSEAPLYIRLWNAKSSAAAKDFEVYMGSSKILEAEAPMGFGGVYGINLPSMDRFGVWNPLWLHMQVNPNDKECDMYGRMRISQTTSVSLEMIEPWNKNSRYIGLNCVEFFGVDGEAVPRAAVKSVTVDNGRNQTAPFKILKCARRTMDCDDMWLAVRENERPVVMNLEFNSPTKIIMIRLWNYNGGEEALSYGVRKLKVKTDEMVVWRGMAHMAKGMTSKIFEGVTDIWLVDKTNWDSSSNISIIQTTRME